MAWEKPRRTREKITILLPLPTQVILGFFIVIPIIAAAYVSFTNWAPIQGINWYDAQIAGAKNYLDIVSLPRFINSILTTLTIVGLVVPVELLIGLGLALAIPEKLYGRKAFVSLILTPMMMLPLVTGFTFQTMYPKDGPINQILSLVSGVRVEIDWLRSPGGALLAIMLADIWQWTPFMFILILAGLTTLPSEPAKAARVLGATEMQVFRHITLPQLKPVIFLAVIIRAIEAFKIFDVPFLMTRGGPGTTTETVSVFLYQFGFVFGRLGFITAGSLIILVLVLIVAIWVTRPLTRVPKEEK